jgi:LEA14-like dessication related protein
MRKLACCLLLILAALGLSSCRWLYQQPVLEKIYEIKVVSINAENTVLDLSISVRNPNHYKLTVITLDVNLLNSDREPLGSADLTKHVLIPRQKSNALYFRLVLDTRSAVKLLNHSGRKVWLYVSGSGTGKVLGAYHAFTF